MIETAKMSERGQIIIPKEIRGEINADIGTIFAVSTLDKDTIVMKKLDLVSEFRKLRGKARKVSPQSQAAALPARIKGPKGIIPPGSFLPASINPPPTKAPDQKEKRRAEKLTGKPSRRERAKNSLLCPWPKVA